MEAKEITSTDCLRTSYDGEVTRYSYSEDDDLWNDDYVLWLESQVISLSNKEEDEDRLSFEELREAILNYKAKSEYKQASIVMLRGIFLFNKKLPF